MITQAHSDQSDIRWRKGDVIGHGSFGTVYTGLDLDTGVLMAVKEIRFDKSSIKEIKSIRDEIEIMKKLDHPNITQYLGTSQQDNFLYILTEWIPGGSIKQLISKFGKLTEEIIHSYTLQILNGLIYLHSHNVLHRDIKPANVLVSDKGTVKLADFGASKQLRDFSSETFEESLKGTPYYLAPEVIIDRRYSYASDVWSLGCTVYEMVTGYPPWKEQQSCSIASLLFFIANSKSPPTIPTDISIELLSFLKTCFQRNPEERCSSQELLLHPFIMKYKLSKEVVRSLGNTPNPNTQLHSNQISDHSGKTIDIIDETPDKRKKKLPKSVSPVKLPIEENKEEYVRYRAISELVPKKTENITLNISSEEEKKYENVNRYNSRTVL